MQNLSVLKPTKTPFLDSQVPRNEKTPIIAKAMGPQKALWVSGTSARIAGIRVSTISSSAIA
jgi:hypothetical protein